MTKEFHYTRIEFPATEKVVGAPINPNVGVVAGLKGWEEEKVEATKESPVVIPESFFEALKRERPDGINWDRVDLAVAVLKGEKDAVTPKPPEPEPTESQKFWRDMYRTGKLSPYQKDRPAVEWSALIDFGKKYIGHPIEFYTKSGKDIMELDMKLRGGADKEYNQLGDMSKRATRMAVMAGNTVPFVSFDIATSIPTQLVIEFANLRKEKHSQFEKGLSAGISKMMAVQNDKVVTALGDVLVTKLTGEKGGWVHEAGDKSADLLQTAADDYFEDAINGPVIESAMRLVFQIPVVGALVEQGWTRLSLLQERSPLHKGIAKSIYMGIGLGIGVWREVNNTDLHPKKSPSAWISNKIWSKVRLVLDRNPYNFFQFVDTGKMPKWTAGQDMKKSIWNS